MSSPIDSANVCPHSSGNRTTGLGMLKRKKPQIKAKRRRILNVAASRRRIKRNIAITKLHQRRRHYLGFFNLPETECA